MTVNISVEIETCIPCNLGFVTMHVNADHKRQSYSLQLYRKKWTEKTRSPLSSGWCIAFHGILKFRNPLNSDKLSSPRADGWNLHVVHSLFIVHTHTCTLKMIIFSLITTYFNCAFAEADHVTFLAVGCCLCWRITLKTLNWSIFSMWCCHCQLTSGTKVTVLNEQLRE